MKSKERIFKKSLYFWKLSPCWSFSLNLLLNRRLSREELCKASLIHYSEQLLFAALENRVCEDLVLDSGVRCICGAGSQAQQLAGTLAASREHCPVSWVFFHLFLLHHGLFLNPFLSDPFLLAHFLFLLPSRILVMTVEGHHTVLIVELIILRVSKKLAVLASFLSLALSLQNANTFYD